MGVRTFAVTKTPGDPGFLDEFNSIASELSGIAGKTLRIDMNTYRAGATVGVTKGITHKLGVIPDFIWGLENPPSTVNVPFSVSKEEKAQWTNRAIRFTPRVTNSIYYICVFALK